MDNTTNSDFLNKITELQKQYYSNNHKNTFFKASQKTECANTISSQISIDELLCNTFYIIPNTNKVFIDYLVFKTFINSYNYRHAIEYLIQLIQRCVASFEKYEVHVNLSTFSVSAAHRYKEIIHAYNNYCLSSDTQFALALSRMYIYNTPNVMENVIQIFQPFIEPTIKSKFQLISKSESPECLKTLFTQN